MFSEHNPDYLATSDIEINLYQLNYNNNLGSSTEIEDE